MIKIEAIDPSPPAAVEVDPYIPLTIRWDIDPSVAPLYLFLSDPEGGYVEFKVHPTSGVLLGLVVINLPHEVARTEESVAVEATIGSPVIDLGMWEWVENPDYRTPRREDIDREVSLSVTVSESRLALWFSQQRVSRYAVAGGVRVGISADEELVVIIAELPAVESASTGS